MLNLKAISRELPVLIAGPTASGKSALAMELAARDGRMVVNADALQVYADWRIISARPSLADEAAAEHRLYGHVTRDQPWSVGHWLREVTPLLDRPLVIVGGTGLYFMALTEGLAQIPEIAPEIRQEGNALRENDYRAMVAAIDPLTAARIDLANPARVQRAWEVARATGRGLADWQAQTGPAALPADPPGAAAIAERLVLRPTPDWLNERIDRRFGIMMEEGALEEARAALPHWQPQAPWARAIGAPELIAHLHGQLSLAEAVAAAELASRQYAKRQRTWFRSRMRDWQEVIPG